MVADGDSRMVDFDKTKHLSDSSIKRRRVEREKLMTKEREREDIERKAKEEEERKLAEEKNRLEAEKEAKLARQRKREERRKAKQLERLKKQEADEMNQKIATEEHLLLITQRRLESVRLLSELFNRLKEAKQNEREKTLYKKLEGRKKTNVLDKPENKLELKEKELREKLLKKFKSTEKNVIGTSNKEIEAVAEDKPNLQMETEVDEFEGKRNNQWAIGGFRRGRGARWNRRGNHNFRDNMHFRGNQIPTMPFQALPFQGGLYPERRFSRWSQFPMGGRLGENSTFIPPPLLDPYYIESALNDPYYKYFHKITMGKRRSRSYSPSRSRSKSRSYSRSYSRSRSRSSRSSRSRSRSRSRHRTRSKRRHRSRTRSRSRTKSKSKSRSRSRRRSRSRSKRRSRSRSKIRSRSRSKSNSSSRRNRSHKRKLSQTRTSSPMPSIIDESKANAGKHTKKDEKDLGEGRSLEKLPSVHTWSKSPSESRSLSWENRKDEPSSSTTKTDLEHTKEKKKKVKKVKKKKKTSR